MKKLIILAAVSMVTVFALPLWAQNCNTLVEETVTQQNSFVLVLDKSGSMNGSAFDAARQALSKFIDDMDSRDQAALIAFSSDVAVLSGFTSDKALLKRAVSSLSPGGQTRLYDAIARAGQMLSRVDGTRAIVYLTDGDDNGSKFSVRDIRRMNIGEGVFVYGIGLGNINHSAISGISEATGGSYRAADSYQLLSGIYSEVLRDHYASGGLYADTGSFTISSLPAGAPVKIDGRDVGITPLKLEGITPGIHPVQILFPTGIWECKAPSEAGYRNIIQARASDLPTDLYVESAPTNAAVYLDDAYVGTTAEVPSIKKGTSVDYSNQLKIPAVPPGQHTLRIIAVPDMDISPSQVFEFDFTMGRSSRYVKVLIFMNQAYWGNGEVTKPTIDPAEKARQFGATLSPFGGGSSTGSGFPFSTGTSTGTSTDKKNGGF